MNRIRLFLVFLLPLSINAQENKLSLSLINYSVFNEVSGLDYSSYSISYDMDWQNNRFWDYSNYVGFQGEYISKRFAFELGLYSFRDQLSFTGRDIDLDYRYNLSYSENRFFLGVNAGAGYNFFKPESKSRLVLKILFFFDKRVYSNVIEDNIQQINRNTGEIVDEYSVIELSGLYQGVRMRPFLQLEYCYQFSPKWYAGITGGYHSGDMPQTVHYFTLSRGIGYVSYDNVYSVGLKLGYTFPLKGKE